MGLLIGGHWSFYGSKRHQNSIDFETNPIRLRRHIGQFSPILNPDLR